jgi:flagellar motor protein MotB
MRARSTLVLALLGLSLGLQGCMVSKKKYDALQAEHDRLAQMLDENESALNAAQDAFRKQLEDLTRERDLYQSKLTSTATERDSAVSDLEKSRKQLEDTAKSLGVGEMRDGRLVLQASLLFPLGSAALSSQGQRALDKVAAAFKQKKVYIQVDGHTDTTPIVKASTKKAFGDNMGLASERAIAVFRHLARKGIPERKMYIRGFGPSRPIASNRTATSKAKNRRVEILFIPEEIVPRSVLE